MASNYSKMHVPLELPNYIKTKINDVDSGGPVVDDHQILAFSLFLSDCVTVHICNKYPINLFLTSLF